MLAMQRDLKDVDSFRENCIFRPEPVSCEADAPTSFGMAHSRGVFGLPDTGLRFMKLLR
jgi:hypothetical protein